MNLERAFNTSAQITAGLGIGHAITHFDGFSAGVVIGGGIVMGIIIFLGLREVSKQRDAAGEGSKERK